MIDRMITIAGTALLLAAVATPAFAPPPGPLPEPATMSLFGVGVASAYLAKRLIRRN
jgi:PEP-CTERM motif